MSTRLRLVLLAAPLALLAACDRGGREAPAVDAGQVNVTTEAPAPPPPVETAPATRAPSSLDADERRRASRVSRDGPAEEAPPEYEGARGAATALPSAEGRDDGTRPETTPPPPPAAPQPQG